MSWKPSFQPPDSDRVVVGLEIENGKPRKARLFRYDPEEKDWVFSHDSELAVMPPDFWCELPEKGGV
jgi:hypothetical protein